MNKALTVLGAAVLLLVSGCASPSAGSSSVRYELDAEQGQETLAFPFVTCQFDHDVVVTVIGGQSSLEGEEGTYTSGADAIALFPTTDGNLAGRLMVNDVEIEITQDSVTTTGDVVRIAGENFAVHLSADRTSSDETASVEGELHCPGTQDRDSTTAD